MNIFLNYSSNCKYRLICFCWLAAEELFTNLQPIFQQSQRHNPIITLSRYPCQVFRWAAHLCYTSSDIYNKETPREWTSFPYSIWNEQFLLRDFFPRGPSLWNILDHWCFTESSNPNQITNQMLPIHFIDIYLIFYHLFIYSYYKPHRVNL